MIGSIIESFRKQIQKIKDTITGKAGPESTPVQEASGGVGEFQTDSERKVHQIGSTRPRRRRSHGSRPGKKRTANENLRVVSVEEPSESILCAKAEPWDLSQFQVPPAKGKTRFHDLDLPIEIMHAVADLKFEYCTPIQAALLSSTLAGRDAAGRAQTGTGKSAVFLISILTHLVRKPLSGKRPAHAPRALVLAPTRELALQIQKEARALARYLPCRIVSVFGGMDYVKQKRQLSEGPVDIVVATPGRLLDFKQQGDVHLNGVEILVIDEADRMLDMGFMPEVRRIIDSTPPKAKRQTMLFSATLTPEITRAASSWTREPAVAEIEPEQVAVDTVEQHVYITTIDEKFTLLYNMIAQQNLDRVIVFGNRRDETRRLTELMKSYGISCALLSGEVTQHQRIRTLEDFRGGKVRVLVATDVAARGLHVEGVSHVVNYNLPMDPEDYVHRIGRTGRAGACGTSVSFATEDDAFQIPSIEKFLGRELHCEHPADEWLTPLPPRTSLPSFQPSRRNWAPRSRPRGWRNSKG